MRTHTLPEHIRYQNTYATRAHTLPEHIRYQNTYATRTHTLPEHICYQNTYATTLRYLDSYNKHTYSIDPWLVLIKYFLNYLWLGMKLEDT